MKIYTRGGDKGETSLFTGSRVPKDDIFIQALGGVDECNSAIGIAVSFLDNNKLDSCREQLETIQHALFDLGASVATPRQEATDSKRKKTLFDHGATTLLEKWIDAMDVDLPPLKTFILPGGDPAGAHLHLARSLCRRAEREMIPLLQREEVSKEVVCYLNRLSDYLFMASRWVNHQLGRPETCWQPHKEG